MADRLDDVLVIGGGIAGTALAAAFAEHVRVRVLEQESQPGYHSTGRSAALFAETYGNSVIRALTGASRATFFSPPAGFAAIPLVKPRPVLVFARDGQQASLEAYLADKLPNDRLEVVSADGAARLCPILRRDGLLGGVVDQGAADIEVHELQQGYLRLLRARGGVLSTDAKVSALTRNADGWKVACGDEILHAPVVVNAAGAWAGQIAAMAGAQDIGLAPRRRTAALVDVATDDRWPMIVDVDERFYAKPDAGWLLLSPADETPMAPCDASADDMDVAIAIDRAQTATTAEIRHVRSKWAGLRSFVEDRTPVVGFDALQPGFFWAAALGGYGIQTAPALSRLAADLVLGRPRQTAEDGCGVRASELSPLRLERRATN